MISIALAVATLAVGWVIKRGHSILVRILLAIVLYVLFIALSPQVYYLYYINIFDNLPLQWVARWPGREPLDFFLFQGPDNMSAHSQGLLGWVLIGLAIFRHGIGFRKLV